MPSNNASLLSGFTLSPVQVEILKNIASQFSQPVDIEVSEKSDIISNEWCKFFANFLFMQHIMTDEPFTKEKFEYAFVAAFRYIGVESSKVEDRTNSSVMQNSKSQIL